jgi:ribosome biogenesis protein Nip4
LTKPITDFATRVNSKFVLDSRLVVEKEGRYYLLSKKLQGIARKDFFYAGKYLGKAKNAKFFPSFNLLTILAETKANKIIIDEKAAWLFICGRDIFSNRITAVHGSKRKGDHTLILNRFGECLGFGRITGDLNAKNEAAVVKNISDVGDFLRREG